MNYGEILFEKYVVRTTSFTYKMGANKCLECYTLYVILKLNVR